jgi:hypothetical protein
MNQLVSFTLLSVSGRVCGSFCSFALRRQAGLESKEIDDNIYLNVLIAQVSKSSNCQPFLLIISVDSQCSLI